MWRFVRCATSLHATRERGRATPARGRQRLSQAPRDPTRRATRRSAAPAAGRLPSASVEPSSCASAVSPCWRADSRQDDATGEKEDARHTDAQRRIALLQQNNNLPTTLIGTRTTHATHARVGQLDRILTKHLPTHEPATLVRARGPRSVRLPQHAHLPRSAQHTALTQPSCISRQSGPTWSISPAISRDLACDGYVIMRKLGPFAM